ncbi:MAG: tetratricopeptide repeat protein [Geminicoccaceae bacterium]
MGPTQRMHTEHRVHPLSGALIRPGVALLLLLAWVTAAIAADPAIRIGRYADHSRLAIEWPTPVEVQWRATPGELSVRSSAPLPLELMNRWSELGGMISSASLSRDRTALQVVLASGIETRAMLVDRNIFAVDFRPSAPGTAANANHGPTRPGASDRALSMRLGEHPNHLRVVIEPVAPGEERIEAVQDGLRITLPGRLSQNELRKLGRFNEVVEGARMEETALFLRLANPAGIRSMNVDGDKLVIDLPINGSPAGDIAHGADPHANNGTDTTHATDAHGDAPAGHAPTGQAPTGHADDTHAKPVHFVPVPKPVGHRSAPAHADAGTTAHPSVSATADHGGAGHSPDAHATDAHEPAEHAPAQHAADTHDDGHAEIVFGGELAGTEGSHDIGEGATHGSSLHRRAPPPDLAALDRSQLVRGFSGIVPSFDRLPVVAAPRENGVELRFLWPAEVPAAVFVRAGHLWVAFHATVDQVAADRETMQRYAGPFIRSIRQEAHPEATVFRFALNGIVFPRVERDGSSWHVLFGSGSQPPGKIGLVRVGPEPGLLLENAEGAITIGDPVVGDTLGLAFFNQAGAAMDSAVRMVNLEFIPTIQGAAWRLRSADLQARSFEQGVLLDRAGGLNLGYWTPDGSGRGFSHASADDGDAAGHADDHADVAHGDEQHATGAGVARPAQGDMAHGGEAHGDTGNETAGHDVAGHGEAAAAAAHGDSHADTGHAETGQADTGHATATHGDQEHGDGTHGTTGHGDVAQGAGGHGTDGHGADGGSGPEHAGSAAGDYLQFGPGNLISLASVDVTTPSTFWEQKQEIMPKLGDARPDRRFMAHVALARLNLAHGFGREALSHVDRARDLLDEIDADKRAGAEAALRALEAVGNLESGRLEEARKGLEDEALSGDDEVALWKTILDIREGRPVAAGIDEKKLHAVLQSYGAPMQIDLGIDLVGSYLDRGKADPAFVLLDHLDRLPLSAENEAQFRRIQATAFARDGDKERALGFLEQAAAAARMPLSLEIEADLDALRLELGKITVDEALAAFEQNRFLWRGLPQETELMRRYGKLLAEGSRAEEALEIWQAAAEKAGSREEARRISEDMSVLFADIIAGRDGWKRTPLQALAVYRRYRELLPTGPVGNALVTQLADEIDGIGLHSVAAAMLDRQAAFRIDDPGARGTTLLLTARMHLDAGDAQKALDILENPELDGLGPAEQARRDRLLADALRDLGRKAELGDRLAANDERWAQAIRIDEAFAAGNNDVVEREALSYLARIDGESPIEGEAANVLLRLAMVRAERNDRAALAELAGQYSERLIDPEDRAMLALVTNSPPDQGASKELVSLSGEFVNETRELLSEVKAR